LHDKNLLEEPLVPRSYGELCGWKMLLAGIKDIESDLGRYLRILPVIQSTGYGKTKACFDLMKHRRVVFFPCKETTNATSQPHVCKLIVDMLKHKQRTQFGSYFQKVVEVIVKTANSYSDAISLREAQLNGRFYDELENKLIEKVSLLKKTKVAFADQIAEIIGTSVIDSSVDEVSNQYSSSSCSSFVAT
jgi:hypothetical protein